MKKFFLFALILGITTQLVGQRPGGPGPMGGQRPGGAPQPQSSTQNKEAEAVLKNYEKTKTDVAGKKAQDAASWVRFGKNITAVYEFPVKNLLQGLSAVEIKVVLKDQRAIRSESKTIDGEEYNVVHYADKDLYYNAGGSLIFWTVTKSLLPQDLLSEAYDAYQKGYELDVKGAQKKLISEGMSTLIKYYYSEAVTAHTLGDMSRSSHNFGNVLRCSEHPVINSVDTIVVYYTGVTAFYAKEYERAIEYLQRSLNMGFSQEGSVYSFLADCYKSVGQIDKGKAILSEGFTKFPSNQSILISLINMYIDNNEDPAKIMDMIHRAQENEPTNESLFYAEGNVWKGLGEKEKAIACYEKSIEINPNYVHSYFTLGTLYYDAAVDIQTKASEELDDKKYDALLEEFERVLEKAMVPFEKSFVLTDNPEFKADIALYLKQIYYRMQSKDEAKYKPLFEKYKEISEGR